jgi:hypothetical protein
MTLEENLIGYVLKALDPDTEREVEAYLQAHPEAEHHVEVLRQALEPLEADRADPEPPAGLRIRTLARIAEYHCQELSRSRHEPVATTAPPLPRAAILSIGWWRRADVLVAASLLLLMVPLCLSGIGYIRHRSAITACQDNMRQMFMIFSQYSDRHGGALPKVELTPPRNFAGVYWPIVYGELATPTDVSTGCPANGRRQPLAVTARQLDELYGSDPVALAELEAQLGGCYAYTLGYRDHEGQLCGLRRIPGQENDSLPILADKPPFDRPELVSLEGNSPNHGGFGQNVLYMRGNVGYFTRRQVGPNGDDIYLNMDRALEAGKDRFDSVLGASPVHPLPSGD